MLESWVMFALRAILGSCVVASAIAVVAFAADDTPAVTTPSIAVEDEGQGSRDLARFDRGARVRVSSWDMFRRHHPLFAIDGELAPTDREAWSPAPSDEAPWAEVLLGRPRHVREVTISFAPMETTHGRNPAHTLRCLAGDVELLGVRSAASDGAGPTHLLDDRCDGADVVRIELDTSEAPFSIYEVVVRGS